MDIAPTLTSIYGISADESWEGLPLIDETTVMLAKQWESQKGQQNNSDCMSARGHNMDRIAVSENDFEGNILSSIRMDGMKLILANKDNPRELAEQETFDLNKDPLEKAPLTTTSSICDIPITDKNTQLKSILGELIQQAAKTASSSDGAELDEATIERMKALGYMEK
jgi:arylsulfatase A-like enzyme